MAQERKPKYDLNALIFVPDPEEGYIPAQVVQEFEHGEEGKVRLTTQNNHERALSKADSERVHRMDAQSYKDVTDMISLKMLNEASLLYNLKLRYKDGDKMEIYTNIGAILVAINPYKDLGLYNPDVEEKYLNCGNQLNEMPPHIFKVAEAAFMNMKAEDKDQSCVITGESGAGKTETTKRFLQYVSEKSRRNKELHGGDFGLDTEQLRQQILDSNPFMEAFGNAKTLRNDNSSRFGKLIEMFFETAKGVVVGARITNYLLEKSRVVGVQKGERNYHIFYQLCDAATNTTVELKKKFHLQPADMFNYTLGKNSNLEDLVIEGENDAQIFEETKAAMNKLKMTDKEINDTFQICSALLHVGNIEFGGSAKDLAELKPGVEDTSLRIASDLLGVEAKSLHDAIIMRKLTGGVDKHHTVAEAEQARDALSKFVYEKLFDWLIMKMNNAMAQKTGKSSGVPRVLGVLDIFGFETFEINSFEQLCINWCNEKLQAFFNLHVFKKEQKEYQEEEIDVKKIGFYDNQGVIDTIEQGRDAVVVVCDDLCGLESSKDSDFLKRILNNASEMNAKDAHQKFLFKPRVQEKRKHRHLDMAFTIKHFAGFVHYNVEDFLQKNKDQLRKDIRVTLADSGLELLKSFFPPGGEEEAGRNARFRSTLGTKFKHSLDRLMERLNLTTPQFVRCVKPNDEKIPGRWNSEKTMKQLNEAGLLEVCKIRKLGYPIKKTHRQFMNDYLCLDKSAKNVNDLCNKLKEKGILYGSVTPNWQVGKTKVFLRSEQLFELERRRGEALEGILKIIHSFARKWLFRAKVKLALKALKKIKEGSAKKNPEILREGLEFFTEKGPLYAKLPVVIKGLEVMKDLQVQLDLIDDLKAAMAEKDFSTIKVKVAMAEDLNLLSHPVVKDATEMLENMQTEKEVNEKLQEAIGAQDVDKLTAAVDFATQNGFGTSRQCKQAESMLKTLKDRNGRIELLRAELSKEHPSADELARLVEELRENGISDDHPLIVEAARKGEMILEKNKKREKKILMLEKQLKKYIKAKNLQKLRELVDAAIQLQYNGELVTEAVDLMKGLQQRQELLDEVSNAARVLREKSKLPDGVRESDLVPLRHAIKTAEGMPRLELSEELQVIEGKRLIEQMLLQIEVQKDVSKALKVDNQQSYYKMLEKVQSLGLQTREADTLVQKVREYEMLKAKADALTNQETVAQLKLELFVPTSKDRRRHLTKRIEKMYSKDFMNETEAARKSRDLAMRSYYKVRSDADFVARERGKAKETRRKMKHAYQEDCPLTKSLIEMDNLQEKKAIQISQMINKYCDSLSGSKKEVLEGAMSFVVEHGICDQTLADEIYIQLAKHLTANPNPLSKNKAWQMLCLCATYFGTSKRFLPYVLHFLQNTVNDVGLEGNYARYTMAQLSMSMEFDPRELKFKPGPEEIRAFFTRPPALLQLELVDYSREDIPIPPDYKLQDAAHMIRKKTKIMIELKNPEWAVYVRATVKPRKQTYKTRLENFYRVYKPENLGNVDQILAYYKGHEEALFTELTNTSNYGPEPAPLKLASPRKASSASKPKKKSNAAPKGTPVQALDDIFDDDDDSKSVGSTASKSSIGSAISAISKIGSTISRVFGRVRGLSTVNMEDLDLPNPTIPWPLPWWVYMGDVFQVLYECNSVPVLTYKRRVCKMRGKPDEHLYLQLQRDFLDGILTPVSSGENARLSVIILCVRLLKAKKAIPFGDRAKLLKAGLMKCIPKELKRKNKRNEEWLDAYVEIAAEKSNDLRGKDIKQLQKLFFADCVTFPTYGMSFFFAQVLKGNVKGYIAKAQTGDSEGAVKIGVNQNEIAFFRGGEKMRRILYKDLQKYVAQGNMLTLYVKKSKKKEIAEENNYDLELKDHQDDGKKKSIKGTMRGAVKGLFTSVFGAKTETIQLYTVHPREMFDLVYHFRHSKENEEQQ